jgi:hypothetical protein
VWPCSVKSAAAAYDPWPPPRTVIRNGVRIGCGRILRSENGQHPNAMDSLEANPL